MGWAQPGSAMSQLQPGLLSSVPVPGMGMGRAGTWAGWGVGQPSQSQVPVLHLNQPNPIPGEKWLGLPPSHSLAQAGHACLLPAMLGRFTSHLNWNGLGRTAPVLGMPPAHCLAQELMVALGRMEPPPGVVRPVLPRSLGSPCLEHTPLNACMSQTHTLSPHCHTAHHTTWLGCFSV